MALDVTGVGNHEFDEGVTELKRMQYGGCHPVDGCYVDGASRTTARDFQWLAANVVYEGTSETMLPEYEDRKVGDGEGRLHRHDRSRARRRS